MKNTILITILISLFSLKLCAQVDLNENQRFKFENNYELSTGKNFDTKSILKLTLNSNFIQNNNLEISFEKKLSESISLSGGIAGERYNLPIFEEGNPIVIGNDTIGFAIDEFIGFKRTFKFEAFLEGRYYINQSQLIANGFGNNVTGLYASAGVGTLLYDGSENVNQRLFSYIGIGVQSRILKHGIIDFNLRLNNKDERIFLAPTVRAGIAISKDYKNLEFNNARCNILKCFEERKYQFKIPLNNLLLLSYSPDWNHGYATVSPVVKFEHRLFKGFSFNHAVNYSNIWNVNTGTSLRIRRGGGAFGYQNNLRWYFLKVRSIAKGNSADNLSGFYVESLFGIRKRRELRPSAENFEEFIVGAKSRELSYGLNAGYQTRLFKRLYIDLQGYVRQTDRSYTFVDVNLGAIPDSIKFRRYGITLEVGLLF